MSEVILGLSFFNLVSIGVGLFLFTMWVEFALFPDRYMQNYFREPIETAAGRNEIRSMIGGTNLGLSIILFLGAYFNEYQSLAFLAVGIVGSAIGWTRVAFLLKDRPHTLFTRLDAVVEPFGSIVLILLSLSMAGQKSF